MDREVILVEDLLLHHVSI